LSKNTDDFNITIENISNSSGVNDVFFNMFDVTWFNNFGENKNEWPRKFTHLPYKVENGTDDGLVSYEYNSDFFRSDDFTDVHNEKYHVLFGGCSETEGVGGNLNELWAYNLYSELKEKYDIGGYYSLARSGNGWHKIALSLMTYVEKYGKPTHFFVLLPNIGRNFYWNEQRSGWEYLQKYIDRETHRPIKIGMNSFAKENLIGIDEYRKQYIEFAVGWKMLVSYCNSHSIKILYSTWLYDENDSHEKITAISKNFMPMNGKDLSEYISKEYPSMSVPKEVLRKRDDHNGSVIHKYWTSSFMKEIERRGLFND
jgi:hypothetical protein